MDTPPVLDAPEYILDFVTLSVEGYVEASGQYTSLSRRDTRHATLGLQGGLILVAVIAFVPDDVGGMIAQRGIGKLSGITDNSTQTASSPCSAMNCAEKGPASAQAVHSNLTLGSESNASFAIMPSSQRHYLHLI